MAAARKMENMHEKGEERQSRMIVKNESEKREADVEAIWDHIDKGGFDNAGNSFSLCKKPSPHSNHLRYMIPVGRIILRS